uniref:Uncharacterized protein n=1 Tax=Daucus carota subsp. sativus TaxID=79200 RepID=A0A164YAA0_DAUCS
MAPSKKTKSATNRTTSNIIKALKKNKSVGAEPEKKKAAIHEKLQNIRKLNKYPHCISRKGYANLEQEMSQEDPEGEIDRSSTWLRARKDKGGKYKTDEITKIAEKIQGSCSKGANGIINKPEMQGVKKKLDLIVDGGFVAEEKSAEKQDPKVAEEIQQKDEGVDGGFVLRKRNPKLHRRFWRRM